MNTIDYKEITRLTASNELSQEGKAKISIVDEQLKTDPYNIPLLMQKAFVLFNEHLDGEAIEIYNQVLRIDPSYIDAYMWLVELLLFHWADAEDAQVILNKALEFTATRADLYYLLGYAFF